MDTEDLTDKESQYLSYLVSKVKLNELELKAKFGDDLNSLSSDLKLRRLSGNIKLEREARKSLIDEYRLKQIVEAIPVAIAGLLEIAKNGEEVNKLNACKYLMRPAMVYLEKQGAAMAEMEVIGSLSDDGTKQGLVINFSRAKD